MQEPTDDMAYPKKLQAFARQLTQLAQHQLDGNLTEKETRHIEYTLVARRLHILNAQSPAH